MTQTFETWTDETAARDVVYDKTKTNFETIRSSWSGTSFPENPVVGQPCYRTDEDKLYYWNGTEWGEKGGGGGVDLNSGDDIFNWIGTSAEYTEQNIESEHPEYLCYITDDNDGLLASRNIGDVFYTTRTDTALNGAVECNGGQYNIADFETVASLLSLGKLPYISVTEFDACVTTHGSCRCFGWDGTDATVFKVPLLEDIYIMAGTATNAGEFISESLPNHQHYVFVTDGATSSDGGSNLTSNTFASKYTNTGGYGSAVIGAVTSPTDWAGMSSGVFTGNVYNGTKVRPDSVRYRAMVQLVNTASDEAVLNCTGVVADIATLGVTKANKDLSNCTKPYVVESYHNGAEWYRVWSDGWIEQGGIVLSNSSSVTYNFHHPFTTMTYGLSCSQNSGGIGPQSNGMLINRVSTTQFSVLYTAGSNDLQYTWRAFGY